MGEDDYNQASDGLAGFLGCVLRASGGLAVTWSTVAVYNTALTAGGTSYLQLDDPLPFDNDFTKFDGARDLARSLTWRRY